MALAFGTQLLREKKALAQTENEVLLTFLKLLNLGGGGAENSPSALHRKGNINLPNW